MKSLSKDELKELIAEELGRANPKGWYKQAGIDTVAFMQDEIRKAYKTGVKLTFDGILAAVQEELGSDVDDDAIEDLEFHVQHGKHI
jgi:hypothetical protein